MKIIGQVALSVCIFLLLTINIWSPLVYINATNTLVPPFVNKKFVLNTVTWLKTAFLYYPYPLPIFFGIYLYFLVKNWKKQSLVLGGLALTYAVFLILSTNLFPWQLFAGKGITLVELIQFPFRFFLYANALLLAVVGVQVSGLSDKLQKIFSGVALASLLVSVGFLWNESYKEIKGHYYSDIFLQKRIHTTLYGTTEEIRASFYSKDLGEFIHIAQKSTPDYVPDLSDSTGHITNEESDNTYFTYRDQVILPNQEFIKEVDGDQLVVTWTASEAKETAVPVIVYQDSQLVLNDQVLDREEMELSTIGVPTVTSKRAEYPCPILQATVVVIASYLYQFDWMATLVDLLYLFLSKIKSFLREKCYETNQSQGKQAIYSGYDYDCFAGDGAGSIAKWSIFSALVYPLPLLAYLIFTFYIPFLLDKYEQFIKTKSFAKYVGYFLGFLYFVNLVYRLNAKKYQPWNIFRNNLFQFELLLMLLLPILLALLWRKKTEFEKN